MLGCGCQIVARCDLTHKTPRWGFALVSVWLFSKQLKNESAVARPEQQQQQQSVLVPSD